MQSIEEKFIIAFEIPPSSLEYPDNFEYYPEITDEIFLELYVIYSQLPDVEIQYSFLNVNDMKKYVLKTLIDNKDTSGGYFKRRIQKLFNA